MRILNSDAYNSWIQFWEKVGNFFLSPDENNINYLTRILISIAIIVVAFFLIKFISWILNKSLGVKKKGPEIDVSAKTFAISLIKIALWLAVAFAVISLLKIDTNGFAGIVSAVGVALGLALQDLIGSFFSGILILQQKYMHTGDFVAITNSYGTVEGIVRKIHFFFTYLTTPKGQIVIIPNKNVTSAVVTNYSTLGKRRIDYDVGVAYNSDIALVKETLMAIIDEDARVLNGEVKTVYVESLGAYSVNVRIRCWTKFVDYWPVYNELSEKILLAFREKGIYIPSSTDRSYIGDTSKGND